MSKNTLPSKFVTRLAKLSVTEKPSMRAYMALSRHFQIWSHREDRDLGDVDQHYLTKLCCEVAYEGRHLDFLHAWAFLDDDLIGIRCAYLADYVVGGHPELSADWIADPRSGVGEDESYHEGSEPAEPPEKSDDLIHPKADEWASLLRLFLNMGKGGGVAYDPAEKRFWDGD